MVVEPNISEPGRGRDAGDKPATSADTSAYALVAPSLDELAVLLLVTVMGGIALMLEGTWIALMNGIIPVTIMGAMARGAVRSLRQSVATVWSPLIWMRAAIFFYGGFGTLTVLTANDETRNYAEAFFVFYAADVLKYNMVIISFALVMLATCAGFLSAFGGRKTVTEIFNPQPSSVDLTVIGVIFLIAGIAANVFFILPYQFGFVRTTFPALISEVAQASFIGLFLCVIAFARSRSPFLWVIVGIGLLQSLLGLMAFSKQSVIMPIVMLLLGYFYLLPQIRRLLIVSAVILTVFYSVTPIVDFGRYVMQVRYGGIDAPAPPAERLEIVFDYFDPRSIAVGDDGVNYASLRFSYVNVGAFVTSTRDAGQKGNTYDNALAVFVPRFLWKDKPVITELARQLSYDATGNWNNSVAPGLAPEAYWNDGWFGIAYMGIFVGVIISMWSIYNLAVQVAGAWYLFPVILLGVRMGSRFDGFFVSDVLGPIAFGLAGHFVLSFGNAAIARRRHSTSPRHA